MCLNTLLCTPCLLMKLFSWKWNIQSLFQIWAPNMNRLLELKVICYVWLESQQQLFPSDRLMLSVVLEGRTRGFLLSHSFCCRQQHTSVATHLHLTAARGCCWLVSIKSSAWCNAAIVPTFDANSTLVGIGFYFMLCRRQYATRLFIRDCHGGSIVSNIYCLLDVRDILPERWAM